MPLKFHKGCKVCKRVRGDAKLVERLYKSKYYVKGGEPLTAIAADTGINYQGLRNHLEKHQSITDKRLVEQQTNVIAKREEAKLMKNVQAADARQDIVDRLTAELEGRDLSELSVKELAGLLLTATKHTDDVAAKKKDQNIDIMKMMAGVRSGEIRGTKQYEEFDPWTADEAEVVA